ncbi:MAG: hypothetical protein H0V05_16830 [Euzebyaceae bacterium]|nr:hypothetical protein [Euzebyaceae bacterium]
MAQRRGALDATHTAYDEAVTWYELLERSFGQRHGMPDELADARAKIKRLEALTGRDGSPS